MSVERKHWASAVTGAIQREMVGYTELHPTYFFGKTLDKPERRGTTSGPRDAALLLAFNCRARIRLDEAGLYAPPPHTVQPVVHDLAAQSLLRDTPE